MAAAPAVIDPRSDPENSSNSNNRKRARTTILTMNLDILQKAYQISTKPSRQAREYIAAQTGLQPRVVQVWFQNQRAREKRLCKEGVRAHPNVRAQSRAANCGGSGGEGGGWSSFAAAVHDAPDARAPMELCTPAALLPPVTDIAFARRANDEARAAHIDDRSLSSSNLASMLLSDGRFATNTSSSSSSTSLLLPPASCALLSSPHQYAFAHSSLPLPNHAHLYPLAPPPPPPTTAGATIAFSSLGNEHQPQLQQPLQQRHSFGDEFSPLLARHLQQQKQQQPLSSFSFQPHASSSSSSLYQQHSHQSQPQHGTLLFSPLFSPPLNSALSAPAAVAAESSASATALLAIEQQQDTKNALFLTNANEHAAPLSSQLQLSSILSAAISPSASAAATPSASFTSNGFIQQQIHHHYEHLQQHYAAAAVAAMAPPPPPCSSSAAFQHQLHTLISSAATASAAAVAVAPHSVAAAATPLLLFNNDG